ncbi:chromosome segregation SMC family protein [Treponema sp.]|uniref:chromosome segregation SMC family protein n=1 Tax=Treponema sp. TaxID=166 RepID=UPI00298E8338|nr:AAA family ATPase [Treponema sp.]MCR5613619.1 AAA family ATPase [Treponema sp.]
MFLKSLDIFGFKSFADKTHIDFSSGITALLGPNGCGKSNVVDAMKWVLAENKSKNLRADKMEDVIFAGTANRPALNVAEVALTIMNENSLLPLEDSEIEIKRRLYRSGEAQYFINGRQVGPSEIRKLFMDTGVGKAAYSVMEQGKIDQILSSKPEDRRYLFEEAAGISRSKAECAEAERELEKTRQNLQQIEISLAEIKRNYDSLKVQSEKTIKYRKIKEEIFNIQLDIQLLKLKGFIETKSRNETSIKEVEEKRDSVRKEIEEIQNSLTENTDFVKKLQEQVYACQQEMAEIMALKSGKLDLQKQQHTRLAEIKDKIAQLEAKKTAIQGRIDDLTEEVGDAQSNLHEKTKYLADIKKNIESFQQNITTAGSQITENDNRAKEKQQQIEQLDADRALLQKELTAITEDIVTMLDAKLKDAGYSENAMNSAKSRLEEIVGKLRVFTEGRKNIFSDASKTGCRSTDEGQKLISEAAGAFEEARNMIATLEQALTDYINASPAFISEFLAPEGIITQKRAIDAKIADNLKLVADYNQVIKDLNAANVTLSMKIDEYKDTLSKLQQNEVAMGEQMRSAEEKITMLQRSVRTEELNLKTNEEEIYSENHRLEDVQEQIDTIQEELAEIERRGAETADKQTNLYKQIDDCNSKVSGKQNDLQKKQELQTKFQHQYEQLSVSMGSLDTEIRNVKQNFLDQYSRDLMDYEEHMYTITTPVAKLKEDLSKAKEGLEGLGHNINLMAPEEFTEVKDRYERQEANFKDTQKTLEDLVRVSEEIKAKSSDMFLDTYNKIKKNFHNMFRRLFNGGHAELRLEDPNNILTTGIDILAQPPGKKLENIALLSGGEKTMTAIALLFATYQVRPSPFCLLDEIDAALDDKNVSSFVTALRSFANISQYIVITHNKKTVMGAGTMLGVTMEESGISKIIALRLDDDIEKIRSEVIHENDDFVEEDVEPEQGVVLPQRPAPRNKTPENTEENTTASNDSSAGTKTAQTSNDSSADTETAQTTDAASEDAGQNTSEEENKGTNE